MNRTVSLLKFITAVFLLFVMVPNGEMTAPGFAWLYFFLLGWGGFLGMIISASALAAVMYMLLSSRKRNRLSDLFSIGAILILYIPICFVLRNIIKYRSFISWFTYWFFIAVSLTTAVLLIKRLITNTYK